MKVFLACSILVADLQNMLSLLHWALLVPAAAQRVQVSSPDFLFSLRSPVW